MARPTLSVVSITRNDVAGLRRTLDSILSQDELDVAEIIVIDGDSTDGTQELLASPAYASHVRAISEPDSGVYEAMNKGIMMSRGEYILWLNSGDTFSGRSSISSLSTAFSSRPLWVIGGAMHMQGGDGEPFVIGNRPHRWLKHAFGLQSHCHQACAFRRDVVTALGGYSQDYGLFGDFDFILRAGMLAQPKIVDDIIVNYQGGGRSSMQAHRIPSTLHQVRVERFGLPSWLARMDALFARFVSLKNAQWRLRKRLRRRLRLGRH